MKNSKFLLELFDWIKSIAFAIILALIINIFVFELSTVDGESMNPTLNHNDRVFALKTNFLIKLKLDYEDIVIIDSELDSKRTFKDEVLDSSIIRNITRNIGREFWVKRIIGKPGDTLEIKDGNLYRNDLLIQEDYIKEKMIYNDKAFVVPDNHYFVMGDNRNNSNDSRYIGPIPFENIRAKVVFRFFPFKDITKF